MKLIYKVGVLTKLIKITGESLVYDYSEASVTTVRGDILNDNGDIIDTFEATGPGFGWRRRP